MNIEWVRKFCLGLPGAAENVQWGSDLVFKVGEKMFCVVALEPGTHVMSFKAPPEEFAELVERPGILPAPYLARAQWVALERFSALRKGEYDRLVRASYDMVVAKLPKSKRPAQS